MPQEQVTSLLERIWAVATVWGTLPIVAVIVADPDDDHVIACAVAAGANCIVSGDSHLLSIGEHEGIAILSPQAFVVG